MDKQLERRDEEYYGLTSDIKSLVKECVATSREVLVRGYWSVGKLIRDKYKNVGNVTKILETLSVDTGLGERTLWYCVKAFDKYPDFEKVPEGKNITWNKLITKYLPEAKKDEKDPELCVICGNAKYEDGQLNAITIPSMEDEGETYHAHKPCLYYFIKEFHK
jgi:hypothetical protein